MYTHLTLKGKKKYKELYSWQRRTCNFSDNYSFYTTFNTVLGYGVGEHYIYIYIYVCVTRRDLALI